MPLIQSKSQAAAAATLSRVRDLAAHYNAAASHLNAIVRDLLALGDDDLAEFCNQLGPQGLNDLTSLHLAHGTGITQLSQEAADLLDDSGVVWPLTIVDVRPLQDKLADQGRELVFVNGVFAVIPISPTE
jgi:hypothetical protein